MVNIAKILNISNSFKNVTSVTVPLKPAVSSTGNVINFVEKASRNKVPVKFSEKALLYSYPEKFQNELRQACQKFSDNVDDSSLSFLKNLLEVNPHYKYVNKLVNNPKDFEQYILAKTALNRTFVPEIKGRIPEKIRQNLAIMKVYNPENYKDFVNSKGFKEILKHKLDVVYLKDITPSTKVDDKFFYDLFDELEKNTNLRLNKIKGLDLELAQKYVKSFDGDICKDYSFLDKFLKDLEQKREPELLNKILKTFEYELETSGKQIKEVINHFDQHPKLASKILEMKGMNSYDANFILNCLTDKSKVISDEMLDYIIKYQQKNPKLLRPYMIGGIDRFLRVTNKDEKLLKSVLSLVEEKKNVNLADLIYSTTPNNLAYLKENVKQGNLGEEFLVKMQIMQTKEKFKDIQNWSIADKIYQETYLPFKNLGITSKHFSSEDIATLLSEMRGSNPEQYKKLEELGILNLIKDKKINPRIILGLRENKDFVPEVYEDLRMLQNGESIIKNFDNFDKILTKTKAGDVVSVKGKLYINNNGKLERWNMTEEKFNDLFPLVDRFTTRQGADDCYLISAMDSLYKNPKSRGSYYKMFEQKGNDIYVTIPAYKDFQGEIKFPNGEVNLTSLNADGAKHIQMVEQTYARTALRNEPGTPIGKNSLTTEDLNYLIDRNRAGHVSNVMQEVLLFNNNIQKHNPKIKLDTYTSKKRLSADTVKDFFEKHNTDSNVICNIGLFNSRRDAAHAMQMQSYNPESKTFQIVDPSFCGLQETYFLDEISSNLYKVWLTNLK